MRKHFFILIWLLSLPGIQQASASDTLTLEQAIESALQNNPGLIAVEQQMNSANAQASAAAAGGKPVVSANYTGRISNNPLDAFAIKLNSRKIQQEDFDPATLNDPDVAFLNSFGIAVKLPVYTGGRLEAEIAGAGDAAEASKYQYERAKIVTALRTTQAYLAAQTAKRGIAIAEKALHSAQKHARTTRRLYNEDRIVESDKLTAEVNRAAYQSGLTSARSEYSQAKNTLAMSMGLPGADVEVGHDIDISKKAYDVNALIAEALKNRRDIKALRAQLSASKSKVNVAKSEKKPTVSLVAGSDWYEEDYPSLKNDSQYIMGVVKMDLYNATTQDKITAANLSANAVEQQIKQLEQKTATDVRNALARLDAAREKYQIARASVASAERAVPQVNERYGEGRTILIDLLQAEQSLVKARQEKLAAVHDWADAEATLQAATGALKLPAVSVKGQ
ncbi:MAG: hypothetical protein DSZ32_05155 [Gammaproteobacteria bacterium]|nr:MAG: hypothetical protein DSZ32_05155 [Gammaproteobacteria bacterium]